MHAVASANPLTFLVETGRGFMTGDPHDVLVAFGVGAALPLALSLWAYRGLRRAEAAGA